MSSASATFFDSEGGSVSRVGALCALVLGLLATVIAFTRFPTIPLLDLPQHLARQSAVSRLLFGPEAGAAAQYYVFDLMFAPYVLLDVIIGLLIHATSIDIAAHLAVACGVVILPVAVFLLLRASQNSLKTQVYGSLLSIYLSTHWYLVVGFMPYVMGVGLSVLAFAQWENLRHKLTPAGVVCYACLVAACYFTHLSTVVFLIVIIGLKCVTALVYERQLTRSFLIGLGVPGAFYLQQAFRFPAAGTALFSMPDGVDFKLLTMGLPAIRFGVTADAALYGAFLALCLLPFARASMKFGYGTVSLFREELVCLAGLLVLFFMLPFRADAVVYLDARTMTFINLFLLLIGARSIELAPSSLRYRTVFFAGAYILVLVNAARLTSAMAPRAAFASLFRSAANHIPAQQRVLSVATVSEADRGYSRLHLGCYYVSDRGGYNPYLFSREHEASVLRHFGYQSLGYAPSQDWYRERRDKEVRWDYIAREYDYILIERPYDPSRIKLPGAELVFQNDAADVLRVHH